MKITSTSVYSPVTSRYTGKITSTYQGKEIKASLNNDNLQKLEARKAELETTLKEIEDKSRKVVTTAISRRKKELNEKGLFLEDDKHLQNMQAKLALIDSKPELIQELKIINDQIATIKRNQSQTNPQNWGGGSGNSKGKGISGN